MTTTRRGRPRKDPAADPANGIGLSPALGKELRAIRADIEKRIGFPISVADTVRHIIHFYRSNTSVGFPESNDNGI